MARWQPELEYEVPLNEPGKHAIAVAFFTPEDVNGTHVIEVTAKDNDNPECTLTEKDRDRQIIYAATNHIYIWNDLFLLSPFYADPAKGGKAYIFKCPYSTLCRQVVTDDEGRVAEFPFDSNYADVKLKVCINYQL